MRAYARRIYAGCGILVLAGSVVGQYALPELIRTTCLQACYINQCPDLTEDCVCDVVRGILPGVSQCALDRCGERVGTDGFRRLTSECGVTAGTSTGTVRQTPVPTPVTSTRIPQPTPVPEEEDDVIADSDSDSGDEEDDDEEEDDEADSEEDDFSFVLDPSSSALGPSPSPSSFSSPPSSASAELPPLADPASTQSNKASASTIVLAVALPLLFIAILLSGVWIIRRRRFKQRRLSINTFMDKSAAYEPDISRPTNIIDQIPASPPPNPSFAFPLPPSQTASVEKMFPDVYVEGRSAKRKSDPFRDKGLPGTPKPGIPKPATPRSVGSGSKPGTPRSGTRTPIPPRSGTPVRLGMRSPGTPPMAPPGRSGMHTTGTPPPGQFSPRSAMHTTGIPPPGQFPPRSGNRTPGTPPTGHFPPRMGSRPPGTPPAGHLPPRGTPVQRDPTPRNSDGTEVRIAFDDVYSTYFADAPPDVDRHTKPAMPKRAAF